MKIQTLAFVNLFKYKVHQDTTDTSHIQYNTFERDIGYISYIIIIMYKVGTSAESEPLYFFIIVIYNI